MNALSWFASFFQGGGPFMFIILATGLLILAITLERFWIIGRASAWNSSKFTKDVCDKLKRGDLSGAAALAEKVKSPAGRVAHAIITSGGRSEQSLLNAAEGEAVISLAPFSHRLHHLGMLGNTATLLGLLGTIFGLTTAFAAVGAADPSQRSAFLAAGISQALNTTAFGLIVAVPAMLVHGFLVGRVEAIAEQVDEVTVRVLRAMTSGAAPSGAQAGAAAKPAAAAAGPSGAANAARKPAAVR